MLRSLTRCGDAQKWFEARPPWMRRRGYLRDETNSHQPDSRSHPSWPGNLKRAADQDRTGIISLEGVPGHRLELVDL
jgi:hypothetical protein